MKEAIARRESKKNSNLIKYVDSMKETLNKEI
jgi:hypothetical protein